MTRELTPREQIEEQAHESPAPAAPAHAQLLALQQGMGNAAFSRMVASRTLARQPAPTGAPTAAEIAAAEAWAAEGVRKGADLTPGNPGSGLNNAPGGFDAEYEPKAGRLTIVMRCGVEFVDGIARDGTARDGLQDQLDAINALPTEIERQQALAQFRWSPDEGDPERVQFMSEVETRIEGFWGGQHEFFLRKSGWSWLGAKVNIDLQVADKSKTPNCHLTIKPVKVPTTVRIGANVAPGQPGNARDQVMNVSSNVNASGSFLTHAVTFGVDRFDLAGGQATILDNVVQTFKGAEAPGQPGVAEARSLQTPVVLTGHASATGSAEHNQRLSEQRVASVAEFMRSKGFVNVTTRVSGSGKGEDEAQGGEVETDRRVDIVIGSGGSQNTLEHEFGHAFGLGDEYAATPLVSPGQERGAGVPQMGDDATHDNLVKRMVDRGGTPLKGAVCEPTDSIMSVGNVVRPQHYATFHASLTQITSQSPWALGAPTGKTDPLPGGAAAGATGGATAPAGTAGPTGDLEPAVV